MFSVTTYHVPEEKAAVVVKSHPVPAATCGNRMQPGAWPNPFGVQSFFSLLQL